MKQSKPKAKQTPIPYWFKRKNGRLVVAPRKKEIVQKLYGKYAANPEFIMMTCEAIAKWWHETNSRRAKMEYQQRLARQQQRGGK